MAKSKKNYTIEYVAVDGDIKKVINDLIHEKVNDILQVYGMQVTIDSNSNFHDRGNV